MINYRFLFKCTLIIIVGAFCLQKKVLGEVYSDVSDPGVVSEHNLRLDSGLTLKLNPDIVSPSYLLGEKIRGQIDDTIIVETGAQFRKLGISLSANRLVYDLVQSELDAEGNVTFFREGELYTGPRLSLNPLTMQGFFEDVSYDFTRINGRGKADRVDFIRPKEVILHGATFTTCPTDRPAWELRSSKIIVDDVRSVATTETTSLYWNNSELIPLGNLSFSISGKRKSGLLAPTFSVNSKLGLDLTVPYYLNIAPNRDLTFYPRLVGRRGVQVGADLRLLGQEYYTEVGLQVLPSDKIAGEDRWFGRTTARYNFSTKRSISLNLNRVSDNDYFADFGASVLAASQRILPTTIQMNGILNGWSYQAGYQGYQVLQDPGAPILPPYEWSPKFTLSKNTDFLIGYRETDIILNAEATHFTHPSLTDGTRLIGKGKLVNPI